MNKKGFMLLEILQVVIILAGALVMVIRSLTMSVRSSVLSEDYAKAALALEGLTFPMLSGRVGSASVDLCGELSPQQCRVEWKDSLFSEEDSSAIRLKEAEITVTWPSGQGEKRVKANTFLLAGEGQE